MTKFFDLKPLQQILYEQAVQHADLVALEFGENKLTYRELNEVSNQIGHILQNEGLLKEDFVGILIDKNELLVEAIFGTIKTGGVFIPLDPLYPEKRLIEMIEQVQPKWFCVESKYLEKLTKLTTGLEGIIRLLVIDEGDLPVITDKRIQIVRLGGSYKENLNYQSHPDDRCYIYFTSGSTGKPKGIVGRHQSLVHYIKWEINKFNVGPGARVTQFASISFDAYLKDVLVPLASGGTVCIPEDPHIVMQSRKLVNWIDEKKITIVHCVPSIFKVIVNKVDDPKMFSELKYILLAGEKLEIKFVKDWIDIFKTKIQLVNLYGPTETTILKMFHFVSVDDVERGFVPIGKPIDGARAIILDKHNKICSVGVEGYIYLRTPFLTHGYYNQPELTDKVFVQNPFTEKKDIIYKTGDIGRFLEDGRIQFIGREDFQVKINGVRIELGEIESRLLEHPLVRDVAVVVKETEAIDKNLCAYIVADEVITVSEYRLFLLESLPEYMIPSYFFYLEQLPLSPNGKIDRSALPEIEGKINTGKEFVKPENAVEENLIQIWHEILEIECISTIENFFELGGHSLKATQLVSRIYKEFDVELSLRDIFSNSTVKKLAKLIQKSEKNKYTVVEHVQEKDYYPVSSTQKRLFTLQQLDLDSTVYNVSGAIKISGTLDVEYVEQIFKKIINRHEIFRTSFDLIDGEIVQRIHKNVDFNIEFVKTNPEQVDQVLQNMVRPFDLSHPPLMRVGVTQITSEKYYLVLDLHHTIIDGTAKFILFQEFRDLYHGKTLPPVEFHYKDYSEWQIKRLESKVIKDQKEFWLKEFVGELPVLNIPKDYKTSALRQLDFEGTYFTREINKDLTKDLYQLILENSSTLYITLLAIYYILLARLTGLEDIIVGSPIAARMNSDMQGVIGPCINTIALRNYPRKEIKFNEFLKDVTNRTLTAFDNQEYPFEMLVKDLNISRSRTSTPLFNTLFVVQNMANANIDIQLKGLVIEPSEYKRRTSKFDLSIQVLETNRGTLECEFEYATGLFKEETVLRFSQYFEKTIRQVVENPELKLYEINLLDNNDKNKLLKEFNQTDDSFLQNKVFCHLFEEQVSKNPDKIALIYQDQQMTYQELNKLSNQLARRLRQMGIGPDEIVGVMLDRSLDLVSSIIAVLKAGGAYLPIDSYYPEERIRYMLEDSNTTLLLSENKLLQRLNSAQRFIDVRDETINKENDSNFEVINSPQDLVYVIYTSGSTGRPKGVMVQHNNFINVGLGWKKVHQMDQLEIKLLQLASCSFDVFSGDIARTFFNGGTMIICPEDARYDLDKLYQLLDQQQVTIFETVPSLAIPLMDYIYDNNKKLDYLQILLVGSEVCRPEDFNRILDRFSHKIKIVNTYGVSEATIDTTYYLGDANRLVKGDHVPIGKPLPNMPVYILDSFQNLQPIGVPGELYIGGASVSRGYLHSPKLTAEKFKLNPFVLGEMMYKTNDLARWLPDGNIEFLGRKDRQVKIRGYRIELGEIENKLVAIDGVKEAVVIDQDGGNGKKHLSAYLVADIDINLVKEELVLKLPDYMVPTFYMIIDQIPLTPNGKIDLKGLPKIENMAVESENYVVPRSPEEEQIADIWAEVLQVSRVGIYDNYFEKGGDSILAIQIVARARQKQIPLMVKDIFMYPTIAEVIKHIDWNKQLVISQEEVSGEVMLNPIQLWFFEQEFKYPHYWNQLNLFKIPNNVDILHLERAFRKLIEHHDGLRMSFDFSGQDIKQWNLPNEEVDFRLEVIDLSTYEYDKKKKLLVESSEQIQNQLDLTRDLLIRGVIFDLGAQGKRLLIITHHLIIDGVSWRIILEDLNNLYRSDLTESLPLKTSSFKDWTDKLYQYANGSLAIKYWDQISLDNLYSLADVEIEENQLADHKKETIIIGKKQTSHLLTDVNHSYNTEINDILLAALTIALTDMVGNSSHLINLEGHGREEIINDVEISRTVGWFTSEFPVLLQTRDSIDQTIKYVKESLRQIPNKGIDYGIGRYINKNEKLEGLNPEISYNYLGQFNIPQNEENGLLMASVEYPGFNKHIADKHTMIIDINAVILDDCLQVDISYNTRYVSNGKIEVLIKSYQENLQAIIEHCMNQKQVTVTVSDLDIADVLVQDDLDILLEKFSFE